MKLQITGDQNFSIHNVDDSSHYKLTSNTTQVSLRHLLLEACKMLFKGKPDARTVSGQCNHLWAIFLNKKFQIRHPKCAKKIWESNNSKCYC